MNFNRGGGLPSLNFGMMRALTELTPIEKGKLLNELFPSEMPRLLGYLSLFCSNYEGYREDFENEMYGSAKFLAWRETSQQVMDILSKFGFELQLNGAVFGNQLFQPRTAPMVINRIVHYAENMSEDHKFWMMVSVLYY